MITKKYYKLIRVSHEDSEYFRIKNESNEAGEFSFVKKNSPSNPNTEYSLDGVTWSSYDFTNRPTIIVAAKSNIYFRGTTWNNMGGGNHSFSFHFTKSYSIAGNLLSIYDYTQMTTLTSVGTSGHELSNLFLNETNLVSAQNVNSGNATTITHSGLKDCFSGCTSLVTAPDLSSVTSVGQSGLKDCFSGCTSLVTAPDLSSVTSIQQEGLCECFLNCYLLATAPDLSSVTSVGLQGLQNCFTNCNSLATGPDFSSVTSVGQRGLSGIFVNCTKLSTVTAPNLSDLTANSVLNSWLNGAGTQATGTKVVRVPSGATITTDSTSGIPTGWTRVDY